MVVNLLACGAESGESCVDAEGSGWVTWCDTPLRLLVTSHYPELLVAQSVIAENVEYSPLLLHELNTINAGVVTARVFYDDGWVIAQAETLLAAASLDDLQHLAWSVGSLAEWATEEVIDTHGGDRFTRPGAQPVASATRRWP